MRKSVILLAFCMLVSYISAANMCNCEIPYSGDRAVARIELPTGEVKVCTAAVIPLQVVLISRDVV